MAETARAGDEVVFEPTGGWRWYGWDGAIRLATSSAVAQAGGATIAVPADLHSAARRLVGRTYVYGPYSVPGAVTAAELDIDRHSLAGAGRVGGAAAVLACTRGRVRLTVAPATTPKGEPDPVAGKQGTFKVRLNGRRLVWLKV